METIFIYFGKMIVCSAVMSAYYLIFLRDKTFHHYNRFYLLFTVIVSLFLPLLKVEYFTIETDSRILLLLNQFQGKTASAEKSFDFWSLGISILAIVSFFLLVKILLGLFKIKQLKGEFPKETVEGITFYNTNLQDAPFSFFRNLFWKNSILINSDLGKQILKHEMVHIEQKHSIDKLFIQIIQSVFWFNPIFYFIKKEINLIHEYLADHRAVKHSDTRAFAQMLLASNFSGNILPATSPFLSSNLKKTTKNAHYTENKIQLCAKNLGFANTFRSFICPFGKCKNKEIKETNKAIAIAVKTLKKDTVTKKIPVDSLVKFHQEKIKSASEKLKKENEKIATLSEQTRKKSDELQKIAKEKGNDSYEFELKAKELDNLGKEIDKIATSDDYVNNVKVLEWNGKELNDVFNSDEFKNQFKFDEKRLKDLEKLGKIKVLTDDKTLGNVYITPPISRNGYNYNLDNLRLEKAKANLSKAEKKKLEKLIKERKEISEKQAELARKQAEIARQQAEITGEKGKVFYYATSTYTENPSNSFSFKSMDEKAFKNGITIKGIGSIKSDSLSKDANYYINGVKVTQEEFKKLSPNDIKSVNIYKKDTDGKKESEIRVETKK